MKRITVLIPVAIALMALGAVHEAPARPEPIDPEEYPSPVEHVNLPVPVPGPQAKSVDTTYVYGGPGSNEGTFETAGGQPDWQGWTHEDLNTSGPNHWHVSTYWADELGGHGPGNYAMNCTDETIPACTPADTIGGYGPEWFDDLEWVTTVADTTGPVTLHLTGFMNYDLADIDWDFLEFFVQRGDYSDEMFEWTGTGAPVDTLDITTVISPGEFTGPDRNQVRVFWRVWSDAAYDDVTCREPGPSHGAARIDDIAVFLDDSLITFDDFEPGSPVNWHPTEFVGVGDFSNLRNDLGDRDPCRSNNTYQVNFVDDGVVVPGTGGTPCIDYCYDPGGWIVNNTGGLLADDGRPWFLENQVTSPPIAWPAGLEGAELSFDVYRDELLQADAAGVFFFWYVRSTDSADPGDLESAPWVNRNFVYNGGPDYYRTVEIVSDLIVPEATWVQVALGVNELGWVWGWRGLNGTPAPYFDNVVVKAWDPQGPKLELGTNNRFGDAFPHQGYLDPDDLASNWCRVDGLYWASPVTAQTREDSLRIQATSLRHGATILEPAELHWVMMCNPVFDDVRPMAPDGSGLLRGAVPGVTRTPDKRQWAFDLPDSGWFFPGDRIHWYVTARDDLDGDIRSSVFPADTTDVLNFTSSSGYHLWADISAIPSVGHPVGGQFPRCETLLVDYFNGRVDMKPWIDALGELGYVRGMDYDLIRPLTLVELGATDWLGDFDTLIHVSGPGSWATLSTSEYEDDGTLLDNWLDGGGRKLLMTGDQLLTRALRGNGTNSADALFDRLGVQLIDEDITAMNGGSRALEIFPMAGNGIFPEMVTWSVPDGCPDARFTEAIAPTGEGQALATLDPSGSSGGGAYASAVSMFEPPLDNRSVILPFDLGRIGSMTVGKAEQYSAQASFLNHLMVWLETGAVSAVDDVPGVREIAVSAHPNPFNPATNIAFSLPRAGAVTLEIFDIQGRKVRTLLNEQRYEAGRHQQPWDGRDEDGRGTSSGVYFYRFATGAEERVGKLTLLK